MVGKQKSELIEEALHLYTSNHFIRYQNGL